MPSNSATAMAAKSAPECVLGVSSNSLICFPFLFLACRPATSSACVPGATGHPVVPGLSLSIRPRLRGFSLLLFRLQGIDSARSNPAACPGSGAAGNLSRIPKEGATCRKKQPGVPAVACLGVQIREGDDALTMFLCPKEEVMLRSPFRTNAGRWEERGGGMERVSAFLPARASRANAFGTISS